MSAARGPGKLPAQHWGPDGGGGEGSRVAGIRRVGRGAVGACLVVRLLSMVVGDAVRV